MVNIHDKASELASALEASPEYSEYKRLKEEVMSDETSAALVKQYKKLQFEAQAAVISGKQPDKDTMDRLQKIGEVLAFNPKAAEYFTAEYRFNTLVSDIYKILGKACDLGVDLFSE